MVPPCLLPCQAMPKMLITTIPSHPTVTVVVGTLAMQTATTITTTTRATLGRPTPSTTTATGQNLLTSLIRTQTRLTRSGRLPRRAATSQSSETGKEVVGNHTHLTTPTTWEGEEGVVEAEAW